MADCIKFEANNQCVNDSSGDRSLSASSLDLLKEGSKANSASRTEVTAGMFNFSPGGPWAMAEVTPEQEEALGKMREGKRPTQVSVAGTQISAETEPTGNKVTWEDNRTADLLGHDLWLLAGVTQAPETFAKDVLKELSTMPEEKLNLVADLLEKGPHHAIVKRDQNGKVESIGYNYNNAPTMKELFSYGVVPGLVVLPQALGERAGRALNRGNGNDVTINFYNGQTTLEARQYWDITGKGYFGGGTHKISSAINRVDNNRYKPFWMQNA
jgi:hypothetical protein